MFLSSKLYKVQNKSLSLLESIRTISSLGSLVPNEGAVKSYKRLGRGQASGKGKTSGRGQKGQKARGKVPRWFEGGQTPFYKRFPIIGFKRPHRKVYNDINLTRIQEFWDLGRIPLKAGETLDIRKMFNFGLITGSMKDGVKILGRGAEEYNVPLNIEASKASLSVIKSIESIGKTYTSVYRTKLGLRAHIRPDQFLLKKGYLPLQARPTHRRDIEYYSNPEKRGYLLNNKSLLIDHLGTKTASKKVAKMNKLTVSLQNASQKHHGDFSSNREINITDL